LIGVSDPGFPAGIVNVAQLLPVRKAERQMPGHSYDVTDDGRILALVQLFKRLYQPLKSRVVADVVVVGVARTRDARHRKLPVRDDADRSRDVCWRRGGAGRDGMSGRAGAGAASCAGRSRIDTPN
jgi:hypothetical protein